MSCEPSTSAQRSRDSDEVLRLRNDDDYDDEKEIEKQVLATVESDTVTKSLNTGSDDEDERIPRIHFKCHNCQMSEMVHHYGTKPAFVYGVQFPEDTYVMRDPFQAPPPRWKPKAEFFVALGAKCVTCNHTVCRDSECSFFYTRTYCMPCAKLGMAMFPQEAQTRLRKQLSM